MTGWRVSDRCAYTTANISGTTKLIIKTNMSSHICSSKRFAKEVCSGRPANQPSIISNCFLSLDRGLAVRTSSSTSGKRWYDNSHDNSTSARSELRSLSFGHGRRRNEKYILTLIFLPQSFLLPFSVFLNIHIHIHIHILHNTLLS